MMRPKYPLYVVTKGRARNSLTVRALTRMNVEFNVVIEPQEFEEYSRVVAPEQILRLPFSNLGLGSIPARNWIWEHAIARGAARHWVLDDNIENFHRLNRNHKTIAETGAIFRAAEDFTDRYENIGLSGFNYYSFCKTTDPVPAFYLNTRIYSCILIDSALPFRWRGRYNEDTDLSLRVLKSGLCTVLFNAFLAGKVTTMRMRGGNTDELYSDDGREKMADALVALHPDIARKTWKFGRWHHQVDYSMFKRNKLIRRKDVEVSSGIDNYGMVLR